MRDNGGSGVTADAVLAGLDRVLDPGVATLALPPANMATMYIRARRHCACDFYRDGRLRSIPMRDAEVMRARPLMVFRVAHAPRRRIVHAPLTLSAAGW